MTRLTLVAVGRVSPGLLELMAEGIRTAVPRIVPKIASDRIDPSPAFDPDRGQTRASDLLEVLGKRIASPCDRILGVTEADLFIPIFTFVFGQGHLDGPAAIVSLHRLRPEVYGLPADPDRLQRRAVIEAVHELGHTFGLTHCGDTVCAMHASRTADEIDAKGPAFCLACQDRVTTCASGR